MTLERHRIGESGRVVSLLAAFRPRKILTHFGVGCETTRRRSVAARSPRRREPVVHRGHRLGAAALVPAVVVSGGLMAVAVGSPDYPWLGWFTLLPLLLSIRILTPFRAMGCGALWGVSLFAFSVSVVGTPIPPTVQSLLLLAGITAAYTYVGAIVTRRFGFSVLFLAYAWIGVEFALKPLALHKGLLASGQASWSSLHLVASLFGYVWVAFLVALVNGLLLSILSTVCASVGGVLRAPRSTELTRWFLHTSEAPSHRFRLIRISQPRAPPA